MAARGWRWPPVFRRRGHDLGIQAATLRQPAPRSLRNRSPTPPIRPSDVNSQSSINDLGSHWALGSPDEYAALFESVYPSEADRRTQHRCKDQRREALHGHYQVMTLMKRCVVVYLTSNLTSSR